MVKKLLFSMMALLLLVGCGGDSVGGDGGDQQPKLNYFQFLQSDNPQLPRKAVLTISSDQISGVLTSEVQNMSLIPDFWLGGVAKVNGQEVVSGQTKIDFSDKVVFVVATEDGEKSYTVDVSNFSELPVVKIETQNQAPILNKEDWIAGTMLLDGKGSVPNLPTTTIEIRGRGNSTWDYPKKPYAIKLGSKAEVAGMPAHKRWVLLAHWNDKIGIRTELAFWLGREYANFDWKQNGQQVELFLNGEHKGTYYLCEHIKVDKNRVPDGYVIEIDEKAAADEPVFYTAITRLPFNVKDPEVAVGSAEFAAVEKAVNDFETILYGDDFLDEEAGYKSIAEIESFVDWWISNEFSKNADATFFTSCYMNLTAEGKIKMGPLWDYDLGWGNYVFDFPSTPFINSPEGFWIKDGAEWITRMFEDPEFVALVKEKWSVMYADRAVIVEKIKELAERQLASVYLNDLRWQRLSDVGDYSLIRTYYKREVNNFIEWINARFVWMNSAIESL